MAEISKEYAEALFALACEENREKAFMNALKDAQVIFEQNPEYKAFLSSPGIPLGARTASVACVFAENYPDYVVSFIQLLCEKRRIGSFRACVEEFQRLLNAKLAVVTARVTSAVALTAAEQTALKQKLEKISGNTVVLSCALDSSLLGGVVVEMNGTVMDGSLRHRLREVKEVMDR